MFNFLPTVKIWLLMVRSLTICIITLRLRQNGRHLTDDTFNRFFLNEDVAIPPRMSTKFVPKGRNDNNPALVQIMGCRRMDNDDLVD